QGTRRPTMAVPLPVPATWPGGRASACLRRGQRTSPALTWMPRAGHGLLARDAAAPGRLLTAAAGVTRPPAGAPGIGASTVPASRRRGEGPPAPTAPPSDAPRPPSPPELASAMRPIIARPG